MRVAATLILIAVLTGLHPAGAAAAASAGASGLAQSVTTLTEPVQDVARAPLTDVTQPESRTTIQDLAIFGLISLGVLGLLWVRRHTSEL